jgi:16S rRNA (cytosine1402-N4)-methyltransferase
MGLKDTEGGLLHRPVMLGEVIELLSPQADGTYIDATAGAGGHSSAILGALGPDGRLICIDRDPEALRAAKERLGSDPRCTFMRGRFSQLGSIIEEAGVQKLDGVLFDLGLSMMQLRGIFV